MRVTGVELHGTMVGALVARDVEFGVSVHSSALLVIAVVTVHTHYQG